MTTLNQTQRPTPALPFAGLTLAIALLAGIGGIVGLRIQAISQETAAAQAAHAAKLDAYGAEWERVRRLQQPRYTSAHDQAVLKAAQEWEARYRVIYPG